MSCLVVCGLCLFSWVLGFTPPVRACCEGCLLLRGCLLVGALARYLGGFCCSRLVEVCCCVLGMFLGLRELSQG